MAEKSLSDKLGMKLDDPVNPNEFDFMRASEAEVCEDTVCEGDEEGEYVKFCMKDDMLEPKKLEDLNLSYRYLGKDATERVEKEIKDEKKEREEVIQEMYSKRKQEVKKKIQRKEITDGAQKRSFEAKDKVIQRKFEKLLMEYCEEDEFRKIDDVHKKKYAIRLYSLKLEQRLWGPLEDSKEEEEREDMKKYFETRAFGEKRDEKAQK